MAIYPIQDGHRFRLIPSLFFGEGNAEFVSMLDLSMEVFESTQKTPFPIIFLRLIYPVFLYTHASKFDTNLLTAHFFFNSHKKSPRYPLY
ncbi:hypothetical protein EMIT079MI2_190015 [Bacillus sp. IT-79MI2]